MRPPLARVRLLLVLVGMTVLGTMISQGFFYTFEPRTELLTASCLACLCAGKASFTGRLCRCVWFPCLSAGALVVFTTHPSDLILALTKLRVPHWFAFMLTLALRFLPETVEQGKRILVAQQLRGAGGKGHFVGGPPVSTSRGPAAGRVASQCPAGGDGGRGPRLLARAGSLPKTSVSRRPTGQSWPGWSC